MILFILINRKKHEIFLILFAGLFCFNGYCQEVPLSWKDGKVFYEREYSANGSFKSDLFAKFYKSIPHALLMTSNKNLFNDKNSNLVYDGRSSFKFSNLLHKLSQQVTFTLEVRFEDNKYFIDIYDFYFLSMGTNHASTPIESSYLRVKTKDNFYFKTRKAFEMMVNRVFESVSKEDNN